VVGVQTLLDLLTDHYWFDKPPSPRNRTAPAPPAATGLAAPSVDAPPGTAGDDSPSPMLGARGDGGDAAVAEVRTRKWRRKRDERKHQSIDPRNHARI